MKKKVIFIIMLLGLFLFPLKAYAREVTIAGKTYNVNYFLDILKEEGITPTVPDFRESTDKVNIYLFYGKGCEHCTNLLNYLNEIAPEYGDYFNVVGFEIYSDENNSILLRDLAELIESEDDGVPFMFIGDQYFSGYSENSNEGIKEVVKEAFDTPKDERADVFVSYEEAIGYKEPAKTNYVNQLMLLQVFLY